MHEFQSADQLVTLNRASTIARLLTGLAHEVNNALLVISGNAELLEERTDVPDAVAKGLLRIRSQSARAAGVINEVLDFARGDPQGRGRVNLRDIAAGAVSLRSYAIGRARLKIALTPSEDPRVIVDGSRVLLLQVMLNLVSNAEQALAGIPGGEIRIEVGAEGSHGVLRVVDSGRGVAAGDRARIFEPFVTTRPGEESSGLGLAAGRRIAELHGGSLDLEVTPAGASFVLKLPLV
jgi:signal transduction histidine kinase